MIHSLNHATEHSMRPLLQLVAHLSALQAIEVRVTLLEQEVRDLQKMVTPSPKKGLFVYFQNPESLWEILRSGE